MSGDFKPGFEVRNPEVEAKLRDIGQRLRDSVSQVPGYGFALWIFSFGAGGDLFYTSNAERDNIIEMMQEFIKKHRRH